MTSTRTGLRVGVLATAGFLLLALGVALWQGGQDVDRETTLLVTGFGPFGPHATNPSWEAARALDGHLVGRTRVRVAELDVVYGRAAAQLRAALRDARAERALCLGVAPGAELILETVARNRDASETPDNEGVIRLDAPIDPDGAALLPTGLPVEALLERLEARGFPTRTSDDAGGYLCNHAFYVLRRALPDRHVAGFVHVPPLGGAWTLERLQEAVRTMVEVLDETP